MKYIFICACLLAFTSSCNSQQSEAKKLAEQIKSTIMPGTLPTAEGSWTMTAKIKGKDWAAASMMPPDAAGRIVGYYKNESIGLPYNRRDMYVGKKIKFKENNVVDLTLDDDVGIYGGRTGEMEITKVDENWAEGKFYFTGNTTQGSSKTVEVTGGFFRISLARKK
jgi:hypothetical protein